MSRSLAYEPSGLKGEEGSSRREAVEEGDDRPLKRWGMAVLLALGWCVCWFVWLGGKPPTPGVRMPSVPSVSYAPFTRDEHSAESLHADVRVLWSPALFSLSSPVGFSRIMLENEIRARPALNPPAGLSNLLDRLAYSGTGPVVRIVRSVREEAAARAVRGLNDQTIIDAPAAPPPPDGGIRLEFTGGLQDAAFRTLQFPRHNPVANQQPWQARAYLEFNDMGVVRHVFLDQPTSSKKLNQYILRQLLMLRLRKAVDGQNGYVWMYNLGPGATWADSDGRRAP